MVSEVRKIKVVLTRSQMSIVYKCMLSRQQVQDQIRIFVQTMTTKVEVETAMHDWLDEQKATDLDKTQIMKDLTSYKEFLELNN